MGQNIRVLVRPSVPNNSDKYKYAKISSIFSQFVEFT